MNVLFVVLWLASITGSLLLIAKGFDLGRHSTRAVSQFVFTTTLLMVIVVRIESYNSIIVGAIIVSCAISILFEAWPENRTRFFLIIGGYEIAMSVGMAAFLLR